MRPKILFTSPWGKYRKLPVEKDPIDYFYYRNTLKQGVFQLRSYQSWHSLHFLAQNVAVDSVVLENPSENRFKKEVAKGQYDIVAICFTILLSGKVLEMAEWIRKEHPSAEIVVGGYGTAIFTENYDVSVRLKSLVHHICYGEGLEFMNELIHKKWGIENHKPLQQDLLPTTNSLFRTRINLFNQFIVVGGLGCVYGCSFCATSSLFNKRYIPLFGNKELVDSLVKQSDRYPGVKSAVIYEEDFLINRPKVLEFIKLFSESPLAERTFLLTIFASAHSVNNFSTEELIACGIGTIFIGVESLSEEVLANEGLAKRKSDIELLFNRLHDNGINTLGSLIVGWDNQSKAMAKADSTRFVAMNPTFYQSIPLHVIPGTAMWEQMKKSNRIPENYQFETDGIVDFNFESRSFPHSEALEIVADTYSELVKTGGPWPFRMFVNLLNGYLNLRHETNPILNKRASQYRKMIFPVCILAFSSRFLIRGKGFRKSWDKTMALFARTFPLQFVTSLLAAPVVIPLLAGIHLYGKTVFMLSKYGDQPACSIRHYPKTTHS
jgi:radical SAM superfamily enzyme YgiQ (UPF0313 family)